MTRSPRLPRLLPVLLLSTAAALAGCTVGPDYASPPEVASSAAHAPGFVRAGDAPVVTTPPPSRWWETLGDATLTALVDDALRDSPTIDAAEARVRIARAALRQERASQLPSVNAQALYAHARLPGGGLGGDDSGSEGETGGDGGTDALNIYNVGFDASWEVDLFGGGRRATEGARATAEARVAELADAQVSLAAEVAQAYVNLRDTQQRVALNQRSAEMEQRMLALTTQRRDAGTASELDVERLRNQVENTQANLVPLRAQVEQYLNQLAVLTGREPGALDATLATPAPVPLPPAQVAIGDPAEMLRRRPDIRAAERTLAASNAQIGVNVASMFPRLSFLGIIGIGGTRASDLTHLDDFIAAGAPMLQWNVLDFGANRARVAQAEGQRDVNIAQYRGAVLDALRDAEDSLARFRHQRTNVASLARAKASADRAASLSNQRFEAGTGTMIEQLDAERSRLASEAGLAQSTAALTNDYVALQKSLGLGWSDAQP